MVEGGVGPLALPVGLRFQPTDVELIDFYLRPRLLFGVSPPNFLIQEADIYEHHPAELSALVGDSFFYCREDEEMYFFTPRHPAGGNSSRRARRTTTRGSGLWDCRSRDIPIMSDGGDVIIGHKVQLTFNKLQVNGNGRKKEKTDWLMHEYRLQGDDRFDNFVLCRIYKKKETGREDGQLPCVEQVEEAQRPAKRQRVVEEPEPVAASNDYPTPAENAADCNASAADDNFDLWSEVQKCSHFINNNQRSTKTLPLVAEERDQQSYSGSQMMLQTCDQEGQESLSASLSSSCAAAAAIDPAPTDAAFCADVEFWKTLDAQSEECPLFNANTGANGRSWDDLDDNPFADDAEFGTNAASWQDFDGSHFPTRDEVWRAAAPLCDDSFEGLESLNF